MKIKKPKSKQPIPSHAKKVFQGKFFETWQWRQRLYDGSFTIFEKIKRPSGVMIIPITEKGKIILIEQKQPGEDKACGTIGGVVDQGENILEAAQRELLEESGYEAREWKLWKALQLMIRADWEEYIFVAKHLKKISRPKPDPGEKITLKEVSFNKFINLVSKDNFRDLAVTLNILKAKSDNREMNYLKKLIGY